MTARRSVRPRAGALLAMLPLLAMLAACGDARRPVAVAPAFGSSGTYRAHGALAHSTSTRTHRSTVRRRTHRTSRAPAGPRLDFQSRTRARCDQGDAGACRMLQSMGS